MKFKMNNRTWQIKEMSQKEIKQHLKSNDANFNVENGKYYGSTLYDEQLILLDKDLHKEQKRQTLKHELMHCYIGTMFSWQIENWNEELVCDISANAHDIIHEIVERYFKR